MFNLRASKQILAHANCTCAQKARNTNVEIDDEEAVTAARARPSAKIEEVTDEEDAQSHKKTPTTIPPSSTYTQASDPQEHPYQQAKDAAYTPLTTKNVGAQDKPIPSMTKKPEPAYRTLPPIHNPIIANSVYNKRSKASTPHFTSAATH